MKAIEIQKQWDCKVTISTLLEDESTHTERANGLDIADFIITELKLKKTIPEIQNYVSPILQYMINKNNVLLILLTVLQLEEI